MPRGLFRYQQHDHAHFITFSCHHRQPHLRTPQARTLFVKALHEMAQRYTFDVLGYVVMPEHVHLLLSEPTDCPLSKAVQTLKLSVAVQSSQRPFWQPRYYDFNVYTDRKRLEKLRYMRRNPVKRGLAPDPAAWLWSSFRHYATGEPGTVSINLPPPRVPHVSPLRHGFAERQHHH